MKERFPFWPVVLLAAERCLFILSNSFKLVCLFVLLDNLLEVNQTVKNLTILENEWVTLECLVTSRSSHSSHLSVEWYVWKPGRPEKEEVVKLSRQATLLFGELATASDLKSRLRLESPSPGLYLLTMQNMTVQDTGIYSCRVEEWLLDPTNTWYRRAESLSGPTTIVVKQPGKMLGAVIEREAHLVL